MEKIQNKIKGNIPAIAGIVACVAVGALLIFLFSKIDSGTALFDRIQNIVEGNYDSQKIQTRNSSAPFEGTSQEEAIVRAVESTAPAVVSVIVTKDLPVIEQCPSDAFSDLPEEFRQFFGGGYQFSVPCQKGTKKQEIGGGSGFLVSSDGYILTNKHVVSDTKAEYTVLTNDGEKYVAKVLARHPSLDIAIIKIQGSGFPTVVLGDSNSLHLGQTAIAIGNALGELRNTVSVGIISGLARSVTAASSQGESETIENVIQTDAAINPGNSGGPLLNSKGEVIGINTAMVSGAQNIGFAIPIEAAKKSIQSVHSSGTIKTAYLGIRYVIINEEVQKQYDLKVSQGALVVGNGQGFAVEKGSPADKAGIREGDILTYIDGKKVDEQHSPAYSISQKNPGETIQMDVLRGDEKLSITATVEERK